MKIEYLFKSFEKTNDIILLKKFCKIIPLLKQHKYYKFKYHENKFMNTRGLIYMHDMTMKYPQLKNTEHYKNVVNTIHYNSWKIMGQWKNQLTYEFMKDFKDKLNTEDLIKYQENLKKI